MPRGAYQAEEHHATQPSTTRQRFDPTPKAGVAGSNPAWGTEKHLVRGPPVRRTGGPLRLQHTYGTHAVRANGAELCRMPVKDELARRRYETWGSHGRRKHLGTGCELSA